MSILGTAIYLITNHISEVQYNNWGSGVWNGLLAIQSNGNCNNSSNKNDEDHKKCITDDIKNYDLQDMWNSDYWKTWYKQKINADIKTYGSTSNKFQKLGSWEKFREVCTKGIDEMIRKKEWSKLSSAVGTTSSQHYYVTGSSDDISFEECLKAATYVTPTSSAKK